MWSRKAHALGCVGTQPWVSHGSKRVTRHNMEQAALLCALQRGVQERNNLGRGSFSLGPAMGVAVAVQVSLPIQFQGSTLWLHPVTSEGRHDGWCKLLSKPPQNARGR